MHIRSRVCFFVCPERFFAAYMLPYAPVGVLFVFHGKSPEYKSPAYGKEIFYYEHEHDNGTFLQRNGRCT